jgi:sec-independent protein translocase protein TatA
MSTGEKRIGARALWPVHTRRLGFRDILNAEVRPSAEGVDVIDGLFQPSHLLVILVIALFVFGPKKLPELGQGLGKGIRSFKESMRNATAEEPEKVETSIKSGEEPK